MTAASLVFDEKKQNKNNDKTKNSIKRNITEDHRTITTENVWRKTNHSVP